MVFCFQLALADAIRKTNHFKDNIGRMSTCFFILCPLSGRGSAKISDEDDDVEFVGCVRIPGTYFNPSIYKVKKKQNNGEFEVNTVLFSKQICSRLATQE